MIFAVVTAPLVKDLSEGPRHNAQLKTLLLLTVFPTDFVLEKHRC